MDALSFDAGLLLGVALGLLLGRLGVPALVDAWAQRLRGR